MTAPRPVPDRHPVPPPGDHGGDGPRIAAALGIDPRTVLDLSACLNPFAPDVPALARRHVHSLGHYPDVDGAEAILAAGLGLPAERMVITAGGSQAIALVADEIGTGWVDEPDFALYGRHLARLDPAAPRWRSDPHSPSGRLARPDEHAGVWDEAYLPLAAATWTRDRPGWALGSLTKAFACPGLRLGYAVAPDDRQADALRRRRPGWAVDSLACALLPELIERADPPAWTAAVAKGRAELVDLLTGHGFDPEPSDAAWVLVPGAAGLRDGLARLGLVIRDCRSFGLPGHARIAVPAAAGLERLDRALSVVVSSS